MYIKKLSNILFMNEILQSLKGAKRQPDGEIPLDEDIDFPFVIRLANKMGIDIQNIKETIEISSHFVEEKTQNEILVCMGTTCSMKGSKFVFDEIQTALKKRNIENIKLDIKKCFGACAYGVNVSVNGDLIHEVTADQIEKIIKKVSS